MDKKPSKSQTVLIGPALMASNSFTSLYTQGMGLIEEVAAYLDSDGRAQSRALSRETSLLYATESMRLTTRLMQLASWLLLQRAVQEGELSADSARAEKSKVKFSATPSQRGGPGWSEMPQQFVEYVQKGDRLFERVMKFDAMDRSEAPQNAEIGDDDINDQLSRLHAAFGKNDQDDPGASE
ncbi:FIG00480696: hypothetical protein [hydrothermal vent metagenome]|uniref:Regulator of CtrA degradation n=1 Tax=hydrothermal vent metagenome TaxID=652676 RepID=A0A3B0TI35_9ZZZZ